MITDVGQLEDMDSLTVFAVVEKLVWLFVMSLKLLLLTCFVRQDFLVWNIGVCGRERKMKRMERMKRMKRAGYTLNARELTCNIFKGYI
jgi:hypothetical protein